MNAIGYIRVSTEGQATDGVSLEMQRTKIQAWCDLNDCTLQAVHADAGLSGSKADTRPGLQAALKDCKKGSVLIVYSLSRLARSTEDTLRISRHLQKAGADLVSLSEKIDTTSAAGKMIFRLLAVLAEFERDQVSERTAAALKHKKAKGERVGSIPYGYQLAIDGTTLEVHSVEQAAIKRVTDLKTTGLSHRQIARRLEDAGYRPRGGNTWHPQTIANILRAAA